MSIRVESLAVGLLETNCYIVYDESGSGIVIDPGAEPERIIAKLEDLQVKPLAILNTHGHQDHTDGIEVIRTYFSIPFYIFESDEKFFLQKNYRIFPGSDSGEKMPADFHLEDGQTLVFKEMEVEVIHTPGHTTGGAVFYLKDAKLCFSGDTLFKGTIGRADLPGGDYKQLLESVQDRMAVIPGDVQVFPGHGPTTTMAFERDHNPYFRAAR